MMLASSIVLDPRVELVCKAARTVLRRCSSACQAISFVEMQWYTRGLLPSLLGPAQILISRPANPSFPDFD